VTTRRLDLNWDEFDFIYDQISRLNEQLQKEVKLNPRAARTPGATNMIQLYQKLITPQKKKDPAVTPALGLTRHELRLIQRVSTSTKERLIASVIPNYEEAARVRGPEIAEKYKNHVVKLKGLVYNVLTPLITKVEGKL
jgi:hypothetical protein